MQQKEQLAKLRWQCRRGMLELDKQLLPFIDQHYLQLSPALQTQFAQLLEQPDTQLFAWLLGQETPKAEFKEIITLIRQHGHST